MCGEVGVQLNMSARASFLSSRDNPYPSASTPAQQSMAASAVEILRHHVARFNLGARTRNFSTMMEFFAPDAELYFEGIPVGPFSGKEAISRAYAERPPDDEIVAFAYGAGSDQGLAICEYSWSKYPGAKAGELEIKTSGSVISKLIVRYHS